MAEGAEPFKLPITEVLDLHAFAPRDVPSVVEGYLRACREENLTLVRLVHGRGRGVQRAEVQRVLRRMTAEGESFGDAPPESGGGEATLVRLAASEPKPAARE